MNVRMRRYGLMTAQGGNVKDGGARSARVQANYAEDDDGS
jgi:hypothetical protein